MGMNEEELRNLLQMLIYDYSRESPDLANIYIRQLNRVFEKGVNKNG